MADIRTPEPFPPNLGYSLRFSLWFSLFSFVCILLILGGALVFIPCYGSMRDGVGRTSCEMEKWEHPVSFPPFVYSAETKHFFYYL